MKLHQFLRHLNPKNAVAILDITGSVICKELSKDAIPIDLYDYDVFEFGSALSEFYNIQSCIIVMINK